MKNFLTLLLLTVFLASCEDKTVNPPETEPLPVYTGDSIHVALGIPIDNYPQDDYLIKRHQYWVSYSEVKGQPFWVAWNLDEDWYGDVPRYEGSFIRDTSLPDEFYEVKHSDYTNSGYDRGHLVRSEERTKTEANNKSTFLLTNIIPMTPDMNRGPWLDFEYFCEELCKDYHKELWVVSGGIYHTDKTLKNEGKVAIPDSCFKIVVVLEKDQTIKDINEQTIVYAVTMPNIEGIRNVDWETYKTTVDAIEYSTKYNFLELIPDEIENELED